MKASQSRMSRRTNGTPFQRAVKRKPHDNFHTELSDEKEALSEDLFSLNG
jgi:hypothetical protein